MSEANRFNQIKKSATPARPTYQPQAGKAWAGTGSTNRYAGTVPGSGGKTPLPANGYSGYNPSSFNAELQGMQDFSNANLKGMIPNQPSAQDLAFLTIPPGGGSPSGGSRSGGGGGGGGGVTPQQAAAYKAVWEGEMAKAINLQKGFDDYEGRLKKAYDPSGINKAYDSAKTGVTGASKAGLGRLGPILQQLQERAAQGRTGVNEAYQAGDERLSALGADMTGRLQAATGGVNDSLAAFGAGQIAPTGAESLQNLIAASRATNSGMRTAADAAMADRPEIYEGLNADVASGITRDETGLLSRVAMQRAAAIDNNQRQLNQVLAQAGLQRMTAEQERQREQDRFRLELAEMGLVPPSTFTGSWNR